MKQTQSKKAYKKGEIIMKQGEKGSCAYIIEKGRVEILIEKDNGSSIQVGTRGAGTIIGEMAIVDNSPRVATVKALEDCSMLEITDEDFSMRLKSSDPVIQMITQVILTRYRDTLKRSEILKESDGGSPLEEAEKQMATHMDVVESIKIANKLKEALNNNELTVYYQPIVALDTGKVKGMEALIRWIDKEQGFISPGLFIPIAEKSGLIVEITNWVLDQACQDLATMEKELGISNELYCSVNFSSIDFAQDNFVENVLETISRANINVEQIKLEITERLLIQQPDNAKQSLQGCRDAGMGIAIDDFGTGYSSLSYLYYFPINILKIDQSFTRSISKDTRSLELVKSIVNLGQNLGYDNIIAEGVEEESEQKLLCEIGCTSGQGYYFARPLPRDEVIPIIREKNNL